MTVHGDGGIFMHDFKEVASGESGLNTSNRCFQIKLPPQEACQVFFYFYPGFIFMRPGKFWSSVSRRVWCLSSSSASCGLLTHRKLSI
uniref:Uncharacterized protein n=1 Tax=Kalanchoe fedtschenkoi TaxID=63787 RepID=A0A7N0VGC1_KALFE